MDGTTVFCGSARAGGARGRGRGVASGDRGPVRGQPELRDQADAALAPARHGAARAHRRKTTTLVAALRTDGLTAPCVFDGAINGARFLAYVEQALAPTLRPRDLVVMDN